MWWFTGYAPEGGQQLALSAWPEISGYKFRAKWKKQQHDPRIFSEAERWR